MRQGSSPALPHAHSMTLPDGRTLERGVEFSVTGEGRFKFMRQFTRDGSITAWGPVGSSDAMWRSFKPEQVKTIHRLTKGRGATTK